MSPQRLASTTLPLRPARGRPARSASRHRRLAPAAAVLLLLCAPVRRAAAAGLLIADGGLGGTLEIQEQTVQVTIDNGIAVTQVDQVFHNTERRQVEALYTFPVPKGASVAGFSMWIAGKEMVGEVVEKQRARQIYDSYRQRRKDPGLLEQANYKTFEMRVFPIGPEADQRVQIIYYQELDFDHDWATYVYPLTTATRPGLDPRTRGKFAINVDLRSEIPVAAVESPSHGDAFATVRHGPGFWQASLETTQGDLNRDVVIAYHLSRPHTGIDLVAARTAGEDGYFLLTLTAGEELAKAAEEMDYVFVLDISGSMNDEGKLALARGSVDAFVHALGAADHFEILTFNVAANPLFRALRPADAASKQEAADFLRAQRARGGTVLEPALRAAYKYKSADRPLNVVILSDGMTEPGERATLLQLIAERPAGTRVFAIGVGNEVNRPLLEQLAEESGGLAAFLSREDNFERQAQAFRRKLQRPAATHLKIALDGADAYDLEPQSLPSLYYGMPVRLYGRYKKAGKVSVHIQAEIAGKLLDQQLAIEIPEQAPHSEIERMWAWHRVQSLQQAAERGAGRGATVDEIVRLGETYSIASEYTSFLVLENDAEFARWRIEQRNAARLDRDRRRQAEVRAELDRLRRKATEGLGPVEQEQDSSAATARGVAPKAPTAAPTRTTPLPNAAADRAAPESSRPRSHDLNLGGAIDPVTAGLAATLVGLGLAHGRRRRSH